MIIACPKCSRRFGVQDGLVPASGRRARCASCGEVFTAHPAPETGDDSPIHFEILRNPGDGPATSSSFVAPAAPPAVLAHRRGTGMPMPGVAQRDSPLLLTPGEGQGAHDRTVALSAETVSALRRTIAAPAPQAVKEPGAGRWIARDELGRPAACDRRELVQMIRAGLLLQGDKLKEEGSGREVLAGDIQDLAYYFALRTSLPPRPDQNIPVSPGGSTGSRRRIEPARPLPGATAPAPTEALPIAGPGAVRASDEPGDEASAAPAPPDGYVTGLLFVAAAAIGPAALWMLPFNPAPVLPFGVGAATGGCLASAFWVVLSARRRARAGSPGAANSSGL